MVQLVLLTPQLFAVKTILLYMCNSIKLQLLTAYLYINITDLPTPQPSMSKTICGLK